jgi:hypothetical protein
MGIPDVLECLAGLTGRVGLVTVKPMRPRVR